MTSKTEYSDSKNQGYYKSDVLGLGRFKDFVNNSKI